MIYLTYEEYTEIGGTLDLTAFNRNIDRACGVIDNATHNRIEHMTEVPQRAKALCRDLVEYLVRYSTSDMVVSSRSQSAGGVSESESYAAKTDDEINAEMLCIVYDYLGNEKDDKGTPLLYKGAMS
jgi:hypothetical protein